VNHGAKTVFEAFSTTVASHGDAPFLYYPAGALGPAAGAPVNLPYTSVARDVETVATRYRAAGYTRGHRVALLLENGPEFVIHFLALNAVGACIVPLNPDWRPGEMGFVLGHSEAALVVALADHKAAVREFAVCGPSDDPPEVAKEPEPDVDECAILYTSGTTGRPKGCILSNAYFLSLGRIYITEGGLCEVRPGRERIITPLPLFHVNALATSLMAMMLSGGCVVQLDRFHPSRWWDDVASSGATIVHYLGVMPAILLGLPPRDIERGHKIRFGFGANADPKHHAAFEARFGFPLIESWAMTETAGGACITASREPRHVGTRCIGKPRPFVEVRLEGDDGAEVPDGTHGELLVRRAGPDPRAGFFSGYLKDPAATEAAWRGGWFHTGDVVRRGPDGSLHFVDRRKNIIRRAGENIAALEVEATLAEHASVRQVAVLPVADDIRDEEVMACVVLHPGIDPDRAAAVALQDWCLGRIAYFKAPGHIAFVPSLPTTATNKVQKANLSALLDPDDTRVARFDLRDRKKRAVSVS
jgi:acyl-CoA synthetase (AMP-forming)/AMP-acid ligase II